MSNSILTDAVINHFPFLRLARVLTKQSTLGRALSRLIFTCLLCTASIAHTPDARAQASGGWQGYVPAQQQQAAYQPQSYPGYYQGYLQQGQYPNQAAPGMGPGVPAGTMFTAKLQESVNSGKAQVGNQVKAKLETPLYANGNAVIPAGSTLTGSVTAVTSSANSNYQLSGSFEIQFTSVQTPDGRTLPISTSIKETGNPLSNAYSGRRTMMPGMGMMGMAPMYAMAPMYMMRSGSGSRSSMAPMMAMMGAMGAMSAMRMMGSGMGRGNRTVNRASEAKMSKGAPVQMMLSQPIMLAMPSAIPPAASSQQPPQYGAAYAQAGYATERALPGMVQ